ncbi:MAG: hypothetical protein WKG07_24430 [Hymenobacter sp.]
MIPSTARRGVPGLWCWPSWAPPSVLVRSTLALPLTSDTCCRSAHRNCGGSWPPACYCDAAERRPASVAAPVEADTCVPGP